MTYPASRNTSSQSGFTLVEIIVASALGIIVILGLMTMMRNQTIAGRASSEKMASIELQRLLTTNFTSAVCSKVAAGQVFDSTVPSSSVSIPSIPATADAGAPNLISINDRVAGISELAMVSAITLDTFKAAGAPDVFSATLSVAFDQTKLARPLSPASLRVALLTDPLTPPNAKKVLSCSVNTAPILPMDCKSVAQATWTEAMLFCGSAAKISVCTGSHSAGAWDLSPTCLVNTYPDDPNQPVSCDVMVGAPGWSEPLFACATATKIRVCAARYNSGAWVETLVCAGQYITGTTNDGIKCSFQMGASGLTDPVFMCQSSTNVTMCTAKYASGTWTQALDCVQAPAP